MREFSVASGGVVARCSRNECRAVIPEAVEPSAQSKPKRAERTESFDVIKAAKQRLRFLKSEIKTLKKLEKERDKLERLIGAAERPLASVSPIKTKTNSNL
jgi:hypothetical protein